MAEFLYVALLLLTLAVKEGGAVCYLAGLDCAACWKTDSTTSDVFLSECPSAIELEWVDPPASVITSSDTDPVAYRFTIDTGSYPTHQINGHDIEHANIHSCLTSAGSCTPFVADSPGLATHTLTLTGALTTISGNVKSATFTSDVNLEVGNYVVIAHIRYWTDANTKIDVAIGRSVEVLSSSACGPGYFHDGGVSDGSCTVCEAGTYTNKTGALACETCEEGFYVNSRGASECKPCPEGQYRGANDNAAYCQRCEKGSYQQEKAQTMCISCPHTFTTAGLGSLDKSDCTCGRGWYLDQQEKICKSCESSEWLSCAGGMGLPETSAGFWAMPVSEVSTFKEPEVYTCRTPSACTGGTFGPPGSSSNSSDTDLTSNSLGHTEPRRVDAEDDWVLSNAQCFGLRTGFMCDSCPKGMYKWENTCGSCAGSTSWPLILFLFLFVGFLIGAYYAVNQPYSTSYSPVASLIATLTLIFLFAQYVLVLSNIKLNLPESLEKALRALAFLSLDIAALQQECAFPDYTSTEVLMFILLGPFFIFGILLLLYGLSFLVYRCISSRVKPWKFNRVINAEGFCIQLIHVVISMQALEPFDCVDHPSGNQTLRDFPHVFCGSEEQRNMKLIGTVACVLYFAVFPLWLTLTCAFAETWSQQDASFVERYKFLFARFSPLVPWWSLVLLFKNLMFSAIPVIFPNSALMSLVLLSCLNLACVSLQMSVWPWIDTCTNVADAVLGAGLQMLIVIFCFCADVRRDRNYLMPMSLVIFSLLTMGLFILLGVQFYRFLWRKKNMSRMKSKAEALQKELVTKCSAMTARYGGPTRALPTTKLLNLASADFRTVREFVHISEALLLQNSWVSDSEGTGNPDLAKMRAAAQRKLSTRYILGSVDRLRIEKDGSIFRRKSVTTPRGVFHARTGPGGEGEAGGGSENESDEDSAADVEGGGRGGFEQEGGREEGEEGSEDFEGLEIGEENEDHSESGEERKGHSMAKTRRLLPGEDGGHVSSGMFRVSRRGHRRRGKEEDKEEEVGKGEGEEEEENDFGGTTVWGLRGERDSQEATGAVAPRDRAVEKDHSQHPTTSPTRIGASRLPAGSFFSESSADGDRQRAPVVAEDMGEEGEGDSDGDAEIASEDERSPLRHYAYPPGESPRQPPSGFPKIFRGGGDTR